MPVNYDSIQADNKVEYGNIFRWGPGLLANRYADRTHFIFEILQNAEDALKKRGVWQGSRQVNFSLDAQGLTISHFGIPFDEADVRGVCGIGEGTKGLTDIGRFGIGFKSVYASTDRPEIHSAHEHFAIDSYVFPWAIEQKDLKPEETKIYIPFRSGETGAKEEILKGLRRLGPRTLLFLREINEISWSVPGGPSGLYLRNEPEDIGNNARKVLLIGQDVVKGEVEEEWIVFSREVFKEEKRAGHVEVAFALDQGREGSQSPSIRRAMDSQLVAFFPTVLTTHLGFLVQGPYRTTPSRDNVPQNDPYNQHLVEETATLLKDALEGLREFGLLNVSALECLPLSRNQFSEGSRFEPLFKAAREALRTEPLLPAYSGGHIAARKAKLARTQELRDLISPEQLTGLFQSDDGLVWLSAEITAGRTPGLREYLMRELDVEEVTPDGLISELTEEFLEAQADQWIERLYGFLNGKKSLLWELEFMPLVRLENGSHTIARMGEEPQAYLPGDTPTGFATVRESVCQSEKASSFLKSLGLRVPDPVDDVIENVLPKYAKDKVEISDQEYQSDIERVLIAFGTDSAEQRRKLLSKLRRVKFIAAVDAYRGDCYFARPTEVYMATEKLKSLFEGVPNVSMVDVSRPYLRGERIRNLLRAAGTPERLVSVQVKSSLTWEEKRELRRNGIYTYEISEEDYTLLGLDSLLRVLSKLPREQASQRAAMLWDALCDVQSQRGDTAFQGRYRWFRHTSREARFPARFVGKLNEAAWVPDESGVLRPPQFVVFKGTGWKENSSLAEVILFKPAIIDELAKEAGIEPEVLDLLKKHGCTTVSELRKRLGLEDDTTDPLGHDETITSNGQEPTEVVISQTASAPDAREPNEVKVGNRAPAQASDTDTIVIMPTANVTSGEGKHTASSAGAAASNKSSAPREFVSFVRVSPNQEPKDPTGVTHEERISLETQAIELIFSEEPNLQRTPTNNKGFDLVEKDAEGNVARWIEVKAMKGTLRDHPVGMTSSQFKFAQDPKNAYWLYIVEKVGDSSQSNIIRIKDPAGKAKTFTFDHGWAAVAEVPN